MDTVNTKKELRLLLDSFRKQGKRIGFVPTMGALHQGHLSLMSRSVQENDVTVVSIYVNPTQFNNKNDLENYPRDLENDLKMIEDLGISIVFTPTDEEMYPRPDKRVFDFQEMGTVMEGKFRPGHFNGVA